MFVAVCHQRGKFFVKSSIQTFHVGASETLKIEVQGCKKNANELGFFFPLMTTV